MTEPETNAEDIGRKIAEDVMARRIAARSRREAAITARPSPLNLSVQLTRAASQPTAGYLVAAGDSWFDYPIHDVLTVLDDDYGYNVESAAHRGDPIESMAYSNGQLDKLARCIDKVKAQGAIPKAVLLSGGGDDIAGTEFGMLLNNATSPIAGWNAAILNGLIDTRIAGAYRTMLTAISAYCQQDLGTVLPVLVHGYDHPVPDGRGFLGGWGPLPGPWLKPGFSAKLFTDLPAMTQLMRDLIDRFNAMLAALAQEPAFQGFVRYVDLRGALSSDLTNQSYQHWWANELHPTGDGFAAVAKRIAQVLEGL